MNFSKWILLLGTTVLFATACEKETDGVEPVDGSEAQFFLGIEAATDPATDVLSPAGSLTEGTISPVNNGFEQPAWMSFFQGVDQIIATGYTSAPEFTSYELVDGRLTRGESFFTDLGIYAHAIVDRENLVLMGSAREGLSAKKIYHVDTRTMTIRKTVTVDFGNRVADSLLAFPVDLAVRGDKLFAAYYLITANGKFATPRANEAHVAVFNYPALTFEKIITDERAPNIGRYYTANALELDENGNIYTFSPSSLASGYAPVPAKNSGVLRIKSGTTEFDPTFHIDFEAISGGYKINDMYYVADGKAVVRVLKEDENDPTYLWASYAPTSEKPLLETGILDLNARTFTLLPSVPKAGGGWNSATMVDGKKLYLGVSNKDYAGIYVIDVAAGTATEGAKVTGNYVKAILRLTDK